MNFTHKSISLVYSVILSLKFSKKSEDALQKKKKWNVKQNIENTENMKFKISENANNIFWLIGGARQPVGPQNPE